MRSRHLYSPALLRARRQELGLSITSLARVCGITPGHLCNIEAGRRSPAPDVARTIAYHLGTPLDALGDDDPDAWVVAA